MSDGYENASDRATAVAHFGAAHSETGPLRSARGGRPRWDDYAVLNGILFVLATGIPWEDLQQSLGLGSGMICCRWLRDCQHQGVWDRLHRALLIRLRQSLRLELRKPRFASVPRFC